MEEIRRKYLPPEKTEEEKEQELFRMLF